MRLIFRLCIAGVAAYVFMPVLRDIAAVDFMGSIMAGLGASVAAYAYVKP